MHHSPSRLLSWVVVTNIRNQTLPGHVKLLLAVDPVDFVCMNSFSIYWSIVLGDAQSQAHRNITPLNQKRF